MAQVIVAEEATADGNDKQRLILMLTPVVAICGEGSGITSVDMAYFSEMTP